MPRKRPENAGDSASPLLTKSYTLPFFINIFFKLKTAEKHGPFNVKLQKGKRVFDNCI